MARTFDEVLATIPHSVKVDRLDGTVVERPLSEADRISAAREQILREGDAERSAEKKRFAAARRRLNAAAPDLLEQCQIFERAIEYQIRVAANKGDDEGARLQSFTLHTLREVLAKATGAA